MKQLLGILLCMMLALPQQSFAQQPSATSKKRVTCECTGVW